MIARTMGCHGMDPAPMTNSRTQVLVLLALAIAIMAVGCSNSTGPSRPAQVKMGFTLSSPELASAVDLVTLEILYPDGAIDLDTLNLIDGEINDTITVGAGQQLTFTLRAYSGGGVLLYQGSDSETPGTGKTIEVNILLTPVADILMLRAGPLFQSSSIGAGGSVDVFVDIYNVDSLFGSAFRIDYDTTILRFAGATEGDFLRGDPPVQTLGGVVKDSLNYVAYALTRVRQGGILPPGVSGSGRLALLHFTRVGVGTTALRFESSLVGLQRPSGEPVERSASLILESATVQVVGNSL